MAEDRMAVLETVRKAIAEGDVDFLREGVRVLAQAVMEAEVTELTGVPAGRARPGAPADQPQRLSRAALGHAGRARIELAIPRVRDGSYFPSLLEPRRRAERALLAVVQEAYVAGRQHPPGRGPRRGARDRRRSASSEVSRICAALDAEVEAFRSRPLADEAYPYLWLDATYVKVREAGRVVSMAALVATGVARRPASDGSLGLELAPGNDEGSAWPALPPARSSSAACAASGWSSATTTRGSSRRSASSSWAAAWQRCRVHFTRNAQDLVPRSARSMVATGHPLDLRAARRGLARGPSCGRVVDGLAAALPGRRRRC